MFVLPDALPKSSTRSPRQSLHLLYLPPLHVDLRLLPV
jgi:hypothetical protein